MLICTHACTAQYILSIRGALQKAKLLNFLISPALDKGLCQLGSVLGSSVIPPWLSSQDKNQGVAESLQQTAVGGQKKAHSRKGSLLLTTRISAQKYLAAVK